MYSRNCIHANQRRMVTCEKAYSSRLSFIKYLCVFCVCVQNHFDSLGDENLETITKN